MNPRPPQTPPETQLHSPNLHRSARLPTLPPLDPTTTTTDSDPRDSSPAPHRNVLRKARPAALREPGRRAPPRRAGNSKIPSMSELKVPRNTMHTGMGGHRRDRTFVGGECAVCEEPLELTLRGERIIQLTCGHVSHEACFYEYIKEFAVQTCPSCDAPLRLDTSRGGGSIDFENLNRLVRSIQAPAPTPDPVRDHPAFRSPKEIDFTRPPLHATRPGQVDPRQRDQLLPQNNLSSSPGCEPTLAAAHDRSRSTDSAELSPSEYMETNMNGSRQHDYDVQAMESAVSNPRHSIRNPIPPPTVTVRSEFPILTKMRQPQSLTCLVTVEVMDGKWQASPTDMRHSRQTIPGVLGNPVHPQQTRSESFEASRPVDSAHGDVSALDKVKDELSTRVDNWHGLIFENFGRLILHGVMRVGKDRQSWQDLECYLFTEMLICVKERKISPDVRHWNGPGCPPEVTRCTLKGSILIKRHLKEVEFVPDLNVLTLHLIVAELPAFNLQFSDRRELDVWRQALNGIMCGTVSDRLSATAEQDSSSTEEEHHRASGSTMKRVSSNRSSSYGAQSSQTTASTEYSRTSHTGMSDLRLNAASIHVPLDIVVVVPVSPSMQGLKSNLLRDALRFLVSSLGERDRMGLVTFGSNGGGIPLVGMTGNTWSGWPKALDSIQPTGQKSMRADVVDGANVAVDLLMQRKSTNPLASILVISDAASTDYESVDFVVSRAEAAKITIHSFGLGLAHKPDSMIEMSTRTKASYTYVKDWMMLRECLAGCFGCLASSSHQNAKLKLRLPCGSPAKFVKISGGLQVTKRATGRDAEVMLGDLRFGDKRDILVQLAVPADASAPGLAQTDPWDTVVAGLEALDGGLDHTDACATSVEELPLIQADLTWGDLLCEGNTAKLARPSLLAITVLPPPAKDASSARSSASAIPPHPSIVQRRMELLSSDMLTRALALVASGKHDRAQHLLAETRSILKGLAKGGLPPLPPPPSSNLPPAPKTSDEIKSSAFDSAPVAELRRTPSPTTNEARNTFSASLGVDMQTMLALDHELGDSLEWIPHPAVFDRDTRKAVLQAIGVISSQRAFTFRTPAESLWATRTPGVRRMAELSREWRDSSDESLTEES